MKSELFDPKPSSEEEAGDLSLRPQILADFVGQKTVKDQLQLFLEAASKRGHALEHLLLHGPPGLGKTTLANIIANELGVNIVITSGPVLEKAGDLAGLLTQLQDGDVLFIDELHRLSRIVEEYLYPAMEEFVLDIMLDRGMQARSLRLDLKKFTLIGATTRAGLLTAPLKNRFGITLRLDFYPADELKEIILRAAGILGVQITDDAADEIARRSRGTPRVAGRLLRRVRDYAEIKADGEINLDVAEKGLKFLGLDEIGLDQMDIRLLRMIADNHGGGPVGLGSLAAALGEEKDTLEEVYEPYLIQQGFLARTARGRVVTHLAYNHLGLKPPSSSIQPSLLDE